MPERIERAARAGYERWRAESMLDSNGAWDSLNIIAKDRWRNIARAVLATLEG